MGFSRPNIDVEEANLGEGGIEAAKAQLDAAFSLYYQEIRRSSATTTATRRNSIFPAPSPAMTSCSIASPVSAD
ncbi:hypothetical protein [Metarhizobium album]|nr:hypothetical protein [Rhizobium album]